MGLALAMEEETNKYFPVSNSAKEVGGECEGGGGEHVRARAGGRVVDWWRW